MAVDEAIQSGKIEMAPPRGRLLGQTGMQGAEQCRGQTFLLQGAQSTLLGKQPQLVNHEVKVALQGRIQREEARGVEQAYQLMLMAGERQRIFRQVEDQLVVVAGAA